MSWGYWKPYVPVAKRRAQAQQAAKKAMQAGQDMQPLRIEGRVLAKTFWGKAWCSNLEAYSDYENRLPRGRSYVRNGAVIDLKIEPGKVRARVMGSRLYQIEIGIAAVPGTHWKTLAKACTGSIASLVELLQGKLSKAVMERICQPRTGLFPAPKDIHLQCSCPDWAVMCKHVAAVLYGVGARLDQQPELLFTLRQVAASELVVQAAQLPVQAQQAPPQGRLLDSSLLSDVFGIELAVPEAAPRKRPARAALPAAAKAKAAAKRKAPAKPAAPGKPRGKSAAKGLRAPVKPQPAPPSAPRRQAKQAAPLAQKQKKTGRLSR
jgi:uncharacterized Zn finger protein